MKHKYKDKVYYSNESEDEIDNFKIKAKKIDGKYKYIHKNPFYLIFSFFMYYIVAKIVVWFYIKFNGIKIVNKKALKKQKGGYFVYGNHTNQFTDGFHPTYTCGAKKPHIIVNADNVSQPVLKHFTPMWGALPLPDTMDAAKNFSDAIEKIVRKQPILIYPEKHLWPYYTKIRPFDDKSFRYPVQFNKPIYTFTTTYQLKKEGKKPKTVIYVDGPFYPNGQLSKTEARKELRDIAFNTMVERSKNSNYEFLTYIKTEEKTND